MLGFSLPSRQQAAAFLGEDQWAMPALAGGDMLNPVPAWWDFKGRARRMRDHLSLQEFSGALGDIGTLVPILISLTVQGSASLTSSLFFGGLWNVLSGFFYGIPMCVQPMKSIAAIALTNKFTRGELAGAGLGVSGIVFFLGVSRLLWVVTRFVPIPVVKGLQLGTCFQLCSKGIAQIKSKASFWGDGMIWSDNLWWACSSFVMVLLVYERRHVPVALGIFMVGVVFALAQTGVHRQFGEVHPGGHFVHAVVPSGDEFRRGFLSAGAGQLPLTLLNSVVAVAALARELFPGYEASTTSIAVSIGTMNVVGCFLGSMPFCHGSGGLAGQYFFGARTELSLYFLGGVKMIIGVVFGESLVVVLKWFPSSFLGVMLFMASIELGLVARNFTRHPHDEARRRQDFVVLLCTAATLVGFSHDGLGFLVGMAAALVFWAHRRHSSGRVEAGMEAAAAHTLLPTSDYGGSSHAAGSYSGSGPDLAAGSTKPVAAGSCSGC
ncbi:hypothetical protein GGI04_000278 [Coemansia thaxteri]|uniref:Sulfate transporter n=1 Tax=Coemansia thaxteri TaxID=2663907 RepID=A0A9W8BAY3_9FUNG|nr:hypothetical protein H4R26_005315 [Coemansia thaxteri]KAJ2009626.1 hypothetical protein GGI04_000278 [Coemansia thaxteri]KAJ2474246.1 hypothetical protein GGI02_000222 [Coemansia sp. RSA 2322]KAJ2475459.1 hypothetical protein EV174_005268 [Coemansia sp. RSA 2320]